MKFITQIFWNADEGRIRALWRLVGLLIVFGIIVVIVGFLSQLLSGQDTSGDEPITLPFYVFALASLVAVWLAGRLLDRRRFAEFGFSFNRQWWIDFVVGLIIPAILLLTIFLIELAAGWVVITDTLVASHSGDLFWVAILSPLVRFISVGIFEEIIYRGYLLTNLAEGFNGKWITPRRAIAIAILVSSILFGVSHVLNPYGTIISTFNICLFGILFALSYTLTGQLAIPIAIHISWNFIQGNVFGFPVSGTGVYETSFIAIAQGGPDLWTGGAFGPEAGLFGILAPVFGCILVVLWVRLRYGQIKLQAAIVEPPNLTWNKADQVSVDPNDNGL